MCYFYVKYKVRKHLNSLISADNFDKVMRDITELHVLKTSADYKHKIQMVLNRWKLNDDLFDFAQYFQKT